jgi:hypothetical protein
MSFRDYAQRHLSEIKQTLQKGKSLSNDQSKYIIEVCALAELRWKIENSILLTDEQRELLIKLLSSETPQDDSFSFFISNADRALLEMTANTAIPILRQGGQLSDDQRQSILKHPKLTDPLGIKIPRGRPRDDDKQRETARKVLEVVEEKSQQEKTTLKSAYERVADELRMTEDAVKKAYLAKRDEVTAVETIYKIRREGRKATESESQTIKTGLDATMKNALKQNQR